MTTREDRIRAMIWESGNLEDSPDTEEPKRRAAEEKRIRRIERRLEAVRPRQ